MNKQNQPNSNIDSESYNPDHSSQNEHTELPMFAASLHHCADERCHLPFEDLGRHKELHGNFDL